MDELRVRTGHDGCPYLVKCKVHYKGSWQCCPRHVPFRGSLGIRYVDAVGPG